MVSDNAAIVRENEAGVSGADVGHDGIAHLHRWRVAEAAPGLEEDEAGHLAIVEGFKAPMAGDVEAV